MYKHLCLYLCYGSTIGTGKWIIKSMVDSKNKDCIFYLKPSQQREINEMLEKITVPHDMDRKPRSLKDLKHWKGIMCNMRRLVVIHISYYIHWFYYIYHISTIASEVQHFLLYFGLPLLKPHIHHEVFHHITLLSTGLWILLKRKITVEEIGFAEDLLNAFCQHMKSIYGITV